jgi:hypothetical protein
MAYLLAGQRAKLALTGFLGIPQAMCQLKSVKRLAALILLSVSFCINAMWVRMSDEDLVKASQVIVKATLVEIKTIDLQGAKGSSRLGTLRVEKTYKGVPELTDIQLALPPEPRLHSSTDIIYQTGQTGLWFLREQEAGSGLYLADHPQRFWPNTEEERLAGLLEALR